MGCCKPGRLLRLDCSYKVGFEQVRKNNPALLPGCSDRSRQAPQTTVFGNRHRFEFGLHRACASIADKEKIMPREKTLRRPKWIVSARLPTPGPPRESS